MSEKMMLKQRLGSGQFGDVFLAETLSGEFRAIKKIKAATMKTSKHVQSLEREIKLLRESEHPNIVKLFGVKRKGDEFWLIFEFCGGGDLSHFIKSRQPQPRLNEPTSRLFFRQLAAGLLFMAENNLVHRDLKPANILLSSASSDAVLKICDFGFARSLSGNALAQTQCGSPLYMAPEILAGQPHDGKVDAYSAGAILFEMITGRPPFGGVDGKVDVLARCVRLLSSCGQYCDHRSLPLFWCCSARSDSQPNEKAEDSSPVPGFTPMP